MSSKWRMFSAVTWVRSSWISPPHWRDIFVSVSNSTLFHHFFLVVTSAALHTTLLLIEFGTILQTLASTTLPYCNSTRAFLYPYQQQALAFCPIWCPWRHVISIFFLCSHPHSVRTCEWMGNKWTGKFPPRETWCLCIVNRQMKGLYCVSLFRECETRIKKWTLCRDWSASLKRPPPRATRNTRLTEESHSVDPDTNWQLVRHTQQPATASNKWMGGHPLVVSVRTCAGKWAGERESLLKGNFWRGCKVSVSESQRESL